MNEDLRTVLYTFDSFVADMAEAALKESGIETIDCRNTCLYLRFGRTLTSEIYVLVSSGDYRKAIEILSNVGFANYIV